MLQDCIVPQLPKLREVGRVVHCLWSSQMSVLYDQWTAIAWFTART